MVNYSSLAFGFGAYWTKVGRLPQHIQDGGTRPVLGPYVKIKLGIGIGRVEITGRSSPVSTLTIANWNAR